MSEHDPEMGRRRAVLDALIEMRTGIVTLKEFTEMMPVILASYVSAVAVAVDEDGMAMPERETLVWWLNDVAAHLKYVELDEELRRHGNNAEI